MRLLSSFQMVEDPRLEARSNRYTGERQTKNGSSRKSGKFLRSRDTRGLFVFFPFDSRERYSPSSIKLKFSSASSLFFLLDGKRFRKRKGTLTSVKERQMSNYTVMCAAVISDNTEPCKLYSYDTYSTSTFTALQNVTHMHGHSKNEREWGKKGCH